MSADSARLDQLAINTIRTLSMDGVQKANSGHPGTPMALAPFGYALWNEYLRYDPEAPHWPGRDRFVLSCGHASMLLYSLIHLAGIKKTDADGKSTSELAIKLDEIKNFRQLNSPCAGHPEYTYTDGIETTTGPLGQGIGNSVGMAIAARWMAATYNRPNFDLFGYKVFAMCSDGDVMEGVGCEAASIAGHLQLSNLVWIYDDNHITIEGETELAFSENVGRRFEGLGWRVLHVDDANDLTKIRNALDNAKQTQERPTLIVLRSIIGWGSPNKANSHEAHGAALGPEEVKLTKKAYGWPEDAQFLVPPEATDRFKSGIGARGKSLRSEWEARFAEYAKQYPAEAEQLRQIWDRKLPVGWDSAIPTFPVDPKGPASRVSSGKVLNGIAAKVPWFLGGSADLAPSTMTMITDKAAGHFSGEHPEGRNFHFGIREHGMAAAANGMCLSGLRPYVSTFFVFSDYLRPSMRLSSLMHLPVLYVFTHDSIGLGEDGPTHQPVEHLAACRAIPGLIVMRPADANEVAEAYRTVLPITRRPVALVLSRQGLPTVDRTKFGSAAAVGRGAYVLAEAPNGKPEVVIMGTGSEIPICLTAWEQLTAAGIQARVVSMPSFELFEEQDQAYRDSVIPPGIKARVACEAGFGCAGRSISGQPVDSSA